MGRGQAAARGGTSRGSQQQSRCGSSAGWEHWDGSSSSRRRSHCSGPHLGSAGDRSGRPKSEQPSALSGDNVKKHESGHKYLCVSSASCVQPRHSLKSGPRVSHKAVPAGGVSSESAQTCPVGARHAVPLASPRLCAALGSLRSSSLRRMRMLRLGGPLSPLPTLACREPMGLFRCHLEPANSPFKKEKKKKNRKKKRADFSSLPAN